MPVMELVFVLKREVVAGERISFQSVWGMPLTGEPSPPCSALLQQPSEARRAR